jgi:hypothetical protein
MLHAVASKVEKRTIYYMTDHSTATYINTFVIVNMIANLRIKQKTRMIINILYIILMSLVTSILATTLM